MDKLVIVLVDDQPVICEMVESILKDTYEVHTFTSGKEAMEYMSDHQVDLALLDYYMPNMTGFEVLLDMRSKRDCRRIQKIPVIFLTSETNERMKMEMMGRGASDYLCKPIDFPALLDSIKNLLPEKFAA